MHSSLDAIFNDVAPEELTIEKQQTRKYNHYIYLMESWHVLDKDNDLTPYVRKIRRIMEMFPDIYYYPWDDLTEVNIELFSENDEYSEVYFPDGCDHVCAFSFNNPNVRSTMRLYDALRIVAVELEKKNHYMFLDGQSLGKYLSEEFIYSEMKQLHRIDAYFKDMEDYAANPEELIKAKQTREQFKRNMFYEEITKTFEREIAAGNLEDKIVERSLEYSNNFHVDGKVEFTEIKDMRGFADGKVPCDGDMPHEVWDNLPSRFIKTAFATVSMKELRRPETIAYRTPEMSREWVKNCSFEITDSRVFDSSDKNIIVLFKLDVKSNDLYDRNVFIMTKIYTSHKKFPYEEAYKYYKLMLNNGN